jgi:DNA-binding response OmpR family regulator
LERRVSSEYKNCMAKDSATTVVIVEDDPNQRKILELALRSEGFAVQSADNGEEGAALVRRVLPSVIVTDVMLPILDGFEMCRRLRRDPLTASIPIVFVTALSSVRDRRMGFDLGADAYLTKPYSRSELVTHIRSVLRRVPSEALHSLPRPRVLLAGQLSAASVVDVLQTIGGNQISGILEVNGTSDHGSVDLRHGRIVHAEVTTPRRHVEGLKAWFRLSTWNEGFFELRDHAEEEPLHAGKSLPGTSLQSLTMEAAYYRDEYERLSTMFPGMDVVLVRTGALDERASPNDRLVWETVGEGMQVAVLLDALELTDLEILRSAFRLMESGLLVATLTYGS